MSESLALPKTTKNLTSSPSTSQTKNQPANAKSIIVSPPNSIKSIQTNPKKGHVIFSENLCAIQEIPSNSNNYPTIKESLGYINKPKFTEIILKPKVESEKTLVKVAKVKPVVKNSTHISTLFDKALKDLTKKPDLNGLIIENPSIESKSEKTNVKGLLEKNSINAELKKTIVTSKDTQSVNVQIKTASVDKKRSKVHIFF